MKLSCFRGVLRRNCLNIASFSYTDIKASNGSRVACEALYCPPSHRETYILVYTWAGETF